MQKGDTRYRVHYAPAAMFETPDDANDGMLFRDFADFPSAAAFACEQAETDFFGVATIERATCTSAKYDWWEDDATWHAEAPCTASDLDINEPSYTAQL